MSSSIETILNLLQQFVEGKIVNLSPRNRENPQIFHYYVEIVRFWSKINFVVRKTLRSIKKIEIYGSYEMARYLYATYRILWEKSSKKSIIKELKLSKIRHPNFFRFIDKLYTFSWDIVLNGKSKKERLSLEEAIPTFVIEHLLPVMSIDFLKENIQFMNNIKKKDEYTVRINDLLSTITKKDLHKKIKEDLKKDGIIFQEDLNFPDLFHVPAEKKKLILKNKWYRAGNLIFQDKGSIAVVHALGPQPNELICDMCAAPGIKTSLIAQRTYNRSRIVAGEFIEDRMAQTKKILQHLNVLDTHLINVDSINFPIRFESKFDRVLLDAPCTGSGTFLNNPELKWHQNERFLRQNVTIQKKLIESALEILKPNGIFVYSTCSLYPEEGELQILPFLKYLDPLNLPKWFFSCYKINNREIPGTGRLFPSVHSTQGFFIGRFRKKEKYI